MRLVSEWDAVTFVPPSSAADALSVEMARLGGGVSLGLGWVSVNGSSRDTSLSTHTYKCTATCIQRTCINTTDSRVHNVDTTIIVRTQSQSLIWVEPWLCIGQQFRGCPPGCCHPNCTHTHPCTTLVITRNKVVFHRYYCLTLLTW